MYYKDTGNHGNMSMSSVWNDGQVFLAIGLLFGLTARLPLIKDVCSAIIDSVNL